MNKKICAGLVVFVFLIISFVPVDKGVLKVSEKQTTHSTSSDMVYSPTPDWVSGSPAYSTGGALADFNNDGWLDLARTADREWRRLASRLGRLARLG